MTMLLNSSNHISGETSMSWLLIQNNMTLQYYFNTPMIRMQCVSMIQEYVSHLLVASRIRLKRKYSLSFIYMEKLYIFSLLVKYFVVPSQTRFIDINERYEIDQI